MGISSLESNPRTKSAVAASTLAVLMVTTIVGCSSSGSSDSSNGTPEGPDGVYDEDTGCALYDADYCDGQQYPNIFVCKSEPSTDCVESPSPTPSPNNDVFCCRSPCHRGAENSDGYCEDGRVSYICYDDQIPAFIEAFDCEPSSQSNLICC